MKTYIVNIIRSQEGFTYTGVTEDLDNRLKQHTDKSLSFWTIRGSNWKVVFAEEYHDKSLALKRERWLKSGIGRLFVKQILNK